MQTPGVIKYLYTNTLLMIQTFIIIIYLNESFGVLEGHICNVWNAVNQEGGLEAPLEELLHSIDVNCLIIKVFAAILIDVTMNEQK